MAAIIFDFDGTIADSFDYVVQFLSEQDDSPPLTDAQKNELKGLSITAMVKKLGFHWWNAPKLFLRGRWQMTHAIKHLKPFAGMPDVVRKLHAEGHELFILSTNSVSNVHRFLHNQGLHIYFLEIYGGVGMFGKAPALRRLLKEQNIDGKDALYVGDELRDIQSAQAVGMRVIAVTWGFARHKSLVDQNPTALAEEPNDIIRILEEL